MKTPLGVLTRPDANGKLRKAPGKGPDDAEEERSMGKK